MMNLGAGVFIWGGAGQRGGIVYLVRDTFTDANDTALTDHTPEVGAGWAITGGTWTIQSNEASSGNPGVAATMDAAQSNVDVQAILTPGGTTGDLGIIARFLNINNLILAFLDDAGQQINIYKRVTGTWTSIASVAYTITNGTQYTVRLTCSSGDVLTMYVDGTQELQVTDNANNTETLCGLYLSNAVGANSTWDDFQVLSF